MNRRQVLTGGVSMAGLGLAGCDRPSPAALPPELPPALSPAGAAALFRPGARPVLTAGDVVTAEVVPAGAVALPSGRLMAADPSWLPAASWSPPMGPFTVADRPVRIPRVDGVAFSTGWGDGSYPTWVGRTRSGRVGCFIVDMLMVASTPATPSADKSTR